MRALTTIGICLVAVAGATGCSSSDGREDARILANMKSDPVMGVVIAAHPGVEAKVVEIIRQTAEGPQDEREKRLEDAARPLLSEHLKARNGHWSDQTVSLFGAAVSKLLVTKSVAANDECIPKGSGEKSFIDSLPEQQRRDIMIGIVSSDPNYRPRIASKEEMGRAMTLRMADTARIAGMTPEQLMVIYSAGRDSPIETKCRVIGATIGTMAEMPPSEGAPYLRAVLDL